MQKGVRFRVMNYKLALDQAPAGRVVDPNAPVRACAYRGPHRGGASPGPRGRDWRRGPDGASVRWSQAPSGQV